MTDKGDDNSVILMDGESEVLFLCWFPIIINAYYDAIDVFVGDGGAYLSS